MNVGHIYSIKCLANGRVYVGKTTKQFKERVKFHFTEALLNERKGLEFHNDIREYGIENFRAKLEETIIREDEHEFKKTMNLQENYYIDYYSSKCEIYNIFRNRKEVHKKTGPKNTTTLKNVGVNVYDQKGNFIKRYNRPIDVSRDLNISRSHVANCMSGFKKHAKGYIIKWEDEQLDMKEYEGYNISLRESIYERRRKKQENDNRFNILFSK